MRTMAMALALALAGCAAQDPGQEIGSVGVAVTATGGDGATYRLTPGTRLSLNTTSPSGTPNYDVGLDGDGTVVTFKAMPGTYNASIYNPDGNYTTVWPLDQTLNGTTNTINAQLVTQQPFSVTVVGGQTTSLVFQFNVPTGKVVFGRGNVNVTIGVGQATSYTASMSGSGDVRGTPSVAGPDPTDLASLMPKAGDTGLQIAVSGQQTGDWVDAGGSIDPDGLSLAACAPFQIVSVSGSGQAGYVDLIDEANHGTAPSFLFGSSNLCVTDDGTTSHVRIRVSREGPADTQAFQNILGAAPALFHIQVIGDLPSRVYNSDTGTLDVQALLGTFDLPLTLKLQIRDDTNLSSFWYTANALGNVTFTFSAQ